MESSKWFRKVDLKHFDHFTKQSDKYHLFHAFRVIEAHFRKEPRFGEARRPSEESVRLEQEAELAFPTSSVVSFTPPTEVKKGRLVNRVFGLFGPNGPLPTHLTEFARDRKRNQKDPTFLAFANMLSNRIFGLFYRAWSTGQPAPSFDRGRNGSFENKLAALSGLRGQHLMGRDNMSDLLKLSFTGHLAQESKNPSGLVSILSAYFRAPVQLQQFIGTWLELEREDQWKLGSKFGLGNETSLGERVWSRSSKFRIIVGPLLLVDYEKLLPGGGSLSILDSIVKNYAGNVLDWDVNLILKAEEVPESILGRQGRLGMTSWIGKKSNNSDANELFLTANY